MTTYWNEVKTLVEITKKEIDEVFNNAKDQADALIALYRKVYPNWDKIKSVDGYPIAGKKINSYLCGKFIEFDKIHHPDVLHGGLWINNGFSGLDNDNVGNWEVQPCEVTLTPE